MTTPCPAPNNAAREAAQARQKNLTKPEGSLGRLEELAIWLAACQAREIPQAPSVHIAIFAADHGIAVNGVSAYPQAVTVEMLRNFSRGGAAINVLAAQLNATLKVYNLGTVTPVEPLPGVTQAVIGPGTANFANEPAMTQQQLHDALAVGQQSVSEIAANDSLFVGGEMGIGNTSSAAALGCALLGLPAKALVGPGTGIDSTGIERKVHCVGSALALHQSNLTGPLDILARLGGFEIAALSGAYITAAQAGIPSLVDGFIATAAALVAVRINPSIRPWLMFSHGSAEPGHKLLLAELKVEPLLSLGLRLGEGSGAAIAVGLVNYACALHANMATFAEASVSTGDKAE